MNITYEQYESAKAIVEEYEENLRQIEDDDYDELDWEEEEQERKEEEMAERAASCNCGAWVFGKDGKVYHVSDCYCGAE
jgi:hypothetical protein